MGNPIRDAQGNVVGAFLNTDELKRLEYALAKLEFFQQEEQDRANGVKRTYDGTNGRTTAEVLQLFRRLDEQAEGR
jgi:hypothetical protein